MVESSGKNGSNAQPPDTKAAPGPPGFRLRVVLEIDAIGGFRWQVSSPQNSTSISDLMAASELLKREVDTIWSMAKTAEQAQRVTVPIAPAGG